MPKKIHSESEEVARQINEGWPRLGDGIIWGNVHMTWHTAQDVLNEFAKASAAYRMATEYEPPLLNYEELARHDS